MTSKPLNPRTNPRRRAGALLAGALLLSPVLSACGFNYATDRVNTISAGANDRAGSVDVLGAVIIANTPDTGVFVATLANNDQKNADTLNAAAAEGLTVPAQPDVDVVPGGHASLIASGGVGVTGPLVPGQFVKVQLGFAGGQTTTVNVNVVRPCFQYSPEKLTTLKFPVLPEADDSTDGTDGTDSPATPGPGEALQEASTEQGAPDPYGCDKFESTIRPDGHAPESEHGSAAEETE